MTPEKYRLIRKTLRLTQTDFAKIMRYKQYNIVSAKEAGKKPITRPDALILNVLYEIIKPLIAEGE